MSDESRYDMIREDRELLVNSLQRRGWLPAESNGDVSDAVLRQSVSEFQYWFKLEQDGWAGPQTKRVLTGMRFCGLPDRMHIGNSTPKWNKTHLTWAVSGRDGQHLPNVENDAAIQQYQQVYDEWSRYSSLTFEYAPTMDEADIRMGSGWIDRAGGTLAWSNLPPTYPVMQKYDIAEPWVTRPPVSAHEIWLFMVGLHELGHALGIPHAPGMGEVMSATYNPNLTGLMDWDIEEIQKRYPPDEPSTDPPDVDPQTVFAEVTIDGLVYRGQLEYG